MHRPHPPRFFQGAALLLALLGAAGCQTRGDVRPLSSDVAPPPVFADVPARCRAADARFAVGQRISAPLLEELRQRTGARIARTVRAGEVASGEVDESRLNVDIEADGRIVAARCG